MKIKVLLSAMFLGAMLMISCNSGNGAGNEGEKCSKSDSTKCCTKDNSHCDKEAKDCKKGDKKKCCKSDKKGCDKSKCDKDAAKCAADCKKACCSEKTACPKDCEKPCCKKDTAQLDSTGELSGEVEVAAEDADVSH